MPSVACTKDLSITIAPSSPCGVPTYKIDSYGPVIAGNLAAIMPGAVPSGLPEWDGVFRLLSGVLTSSPTCYCINGKAITLQISNPSTTITTAFGCSVDWTPLFPGCKECFAALLPASISSTSQIDVFDGVDVPVSLFNLVVGVPGGYKTVTPDTCGITGLNVTGPDHGGISYKIIGAPLFTVSTYP